MFHVPIYLMGNLVPELIPPLYIFGKDKIQNNFCVQDLSFKAFYKLVMLIYY